MDSLKDWELESSKDYLLRHLRKHHTEREIIEVVNDELMKAGHEPFLGDLPACFDYRWTVAARRFGINICTTDPETYRPDDQPDETECRERPSRSDHLAKNDGWPMPECEEAAGKTEPDLVEKPSHYARYVIEPITFIMRNGIEFWRGNIVKYAARAGHKLYDGQTAKESEVTDLKKVIRYAEMRINQLEGKTEL